MQPNRLMQNVYRKKLLAFTIISAGMPADSAHDEVGRLTCTAFMQDMISGSYGSGNY